MRYLPVSLSQAEKAGIIIMLGAFALVGCLVLSYFGYLWLYAPEPPTLLPAFSAPADNAPKDCDCSGDVLSCADFASQEQAQQCFDYCRAWGKGDIYNLDGDNDLVVCEGL